MYILLFPFFPPNLKDSILSVEALHLAVFTGSYTLEIMLYQFVESIIIYVFVCERVCVPVFSS